MPPEKRDKEINYSRRSKRDEMISVHYLTSEEEKSIKARIPWSRIDRRIRELVLEFNKVNGIVTIQSCEGHVRPTEKEYFHVTNASVCLRVNEERYREILRVAPECGIRDIILRYFDNGSFWIALEWPPTEYGMAYVLVRHLLKKGN